MSKAPILDYFLDNLRHLEPRVQLINDLLNTEWEYGPITDEIRDRVTAAMNSRPTPMTPFENAVYTTLAFCLEPSDEHLFRPKMVERLLDYYALGIEEWPSFPGLGSSDTDSK